ncbi:hypothetical protein APHAL10511_007181 [Amanita phalloides]|nr:hypothetical protein APHAL10511_007181 [Amanita phalloides]
MSSGIDYAKALGYDSLPAAIVFAILYTPLAIYYLRFLFQRLDRFVIALVLFCYVRVAAFIIRAILIANTAAGRNESLFIADQVLLNVGYFGLLLAAYELVLERLIYVEESYFDKTIQTPQNGIFNLTRNPPAVHAALTVALIIGIVGVSDTFSSKQSDVNTGSTLRKVSVVLFLVFTALQTLQTLYLVKLELTDQGIKFPSHAPFGARNGAIILLTISLILLVREIFLTATLGKLSVEFNEHYWYPFVAVPELIAVVLYLIPGIIPPKASNM